MFPESFREIPHRRYNPLTREWVLVSPHRAKRPWLGQVEKTALENLTAYDPGCYLCPGNERAAGRRNPAYTGTFVFDNDFPALLRPEQAEINSGHQDNDSSAIFQIQPETGICRVVCFSPRHDLSLPEMPPAGVEAVIQTWSEQTRLLGRLDDIAYVQVFENKGAMMGCSNPHPHSQVWATSHIPNEPAKEIEAQAEYLENRGACLLCDYLSSEQLSGERIVASNPHFVALVPFWAVWPFELLLIARRHAASLPDLSAEEITALADLLRRVTTRYDQPLRNLIPLFDGLPPGAQRRAVLPPMPPARPFLPASAAFGYGAQIHGRIRDAGYAPAGSHPGDRCRAPAHCQRGALPERKLIYGHHRSLNHPADR